LEQFDGTLLNPGVEFAPPQSGDAPNPPGFGFGFIRSLRRGAVQGDLTLDFRLAEHPDIGTRTLMTALADATLFVGEAPDVRRAREINGDVYKTSAPVFCIRCQGENLHSTFIATHEPVNGEPKIRAIAAQQTSGALLLRIDRGELGVDWFVMALDDWAEAEFGTSLGPLRFSGRFGLARSDSQGRVCAAWLVDGGLLALGDRKLGPAGRWIGNVTGYDQEVRPDGAHGFFDVDEPFRPAHPYLLLLHFADGTIWPFNVVAVEPIPGGTRVHVNETPAFQVGGGKTRLTAYPQREIAGEALAVVMPDTVAAEWPPPDRVGGP
jgi:hypothetical protein